MTNWFTNLCGSFEAAMIDWADDRNTNEYIVSDVRIHPSGHEHMATLLLASAEPSTEEDMDGPVEFHIDWVNWPVLMDVVQGLKPGDRIDLATRRNESYFASGTEVLSIKKKTSAMLHPALSQP